MQQPPQLNHPVYIQKKKSVWPWIIAGLLIVMLAGGLLMSLVANVVLIKGSARKGVVRVGRDRFSEVLVKGEGDAKIVIIPIRGILSPHPSLLALLLGLPQGPTTGDLLRMVRRAASDPGVASILLEIDSPGGNASGIADLADAVHDAAQATPITAVVEGQASSAAYWVASQATSIQIRQDAQVGSIGAFTVLIDSTKMHEDAGVKVIPVASGEHKTTGLSGTSITKAQVAVEQHNVNVFAGMFKAGVVRGRPQLAGSIDDLADGRAWVGAEAVELDLADAVVRPDLLFDAIERTGLDVDVEAKRLACAERMEALTAQIQPLTDSAAAHRGSARAQDSRRRGTGAAHLLKARAVEDELATIQAELQRIGGN